MDIFLDPTSRGGKSGSLYEQLRDAITSGRLAEGDRLPTSRALAAELGLARATVTGVYGRLVAEGYVAGRGSAGSFVTFGSFGADPARPRPSALKAGNVGLADSSAWSLGGFDTIEPRVDLRTGRPDPALFPLREWRRAMAHAHDTPPTGYRHPAGLPTLRRAIAQWVGRSRAVEAAADQVIITAGAQQGIDLVARLMLQPGDAVAVEDPGYPPVASLLRSLGAEVVPVPVDREGIVVDAIPPAARIVYVTPSHQSPTGVPMSMARRRSLLDIAAAHNLAVIEDDYDTEYRHGDRPLEPLYRLDDSGRVIYVGTFSKTLSPSLRLGFLVVPPSLADDAITLRGLMDWQPPAAAQNALRTFIIDGHLDRHLRRTRRLYTERHEIVSTWLDEQREVGWVSEVLPSEAGLHLTAHLADGVTEEDVRAAARRHGIALGNYAQCRRSGPPVEGMIIGFGAAAAADLPGALDALAGELQANRPLTKGRPITDPAKA